MEFYQALSQYYDEIFPLKQDQERFLQGYTSREQIKSVLDVGCATGSYALLLSAWGIAATGIDLSEEMVRIARLKAEQNGSRAQFQSANMLDLEPIHKGFDTVICIGNTLAHVDSYAELETALRQFAAKAPRLLIQLVNYDRIFANQISELPEIRTKSLVFRRFYKPLPSGQIEFVMEIIRHGQNAALRSSNQLLPITRKSLEQALLSVGWQPSKWWGNFGSAPWSLETPATIVEAKLAIDSLNKIK